MSWRPSYAYGLKSSVEGELKDKLQEADRKIILAKVEETIAWLDSNGAAEATQAAVIRAHLKFIPPCWIC